MFLGQWLVVFFKNAKDSSINTNKLTYAGSLKTLTKIKCNNGYTFEQVDFCNKEEIIRVFNEYKPNLVMHLANESHVNRSTSSSSDFIQTNTVSTHNMLEVAKAY